MYIYIYICMYIYIYIYTGLGDSAPPLSEVGPGDDGLRDLDPYGPCIVYYSTYTSLV